MSLPCLIPTQRNLAIPWRKKACWTEAPAQVGYFNPVKGNSPTAVRPETMHKHFTQLFLWWDLMACYLRHLLKIKCPLYAAQPASHCWLLKPQLWTASWVLLMAEKNNKPACFKLLLITLCVTVSGTLCAKTKNLQHPPHVSLLPQIRLLRGDKVEAQLWQQLITCSL